MKIFSLIIAIITLSFSMHSFAETGRCDFTVHFKPNDGSEDQVEESIKKNNCGGFYMNCLEVYGKTFLFPEKFQIEHHLTDISREECEKQVVAACKYSNDTAVRHRRVIARFENKPFTAYMCGAGGKPMSVGVIPSKETPLAEPGSAPVATPTKRSKTSQ